MKCYLKTLTPLHIGNGEELSSLDYIIYNNFFYRISQQQFFNFLKQQNIDISNYSNWIVNKSNEINNLESDIKSNKKNLDQNQKLSELRKQFNLFEFAKEIKKENDFIKFLKNQSEITKIKINGKNLRQKNIRGFIKNGNNQPYVPATSIKGAIRTALLFDYLNNYNNINNIKNIILSNLNKDNATKENFCPELEHLAFYCGIKINNNIQTKYDDEKFDILKFLIISDGKIITDDALTIDNVDLYLISKDKKGTFANVQPQAPTIEVLKEGTTIEFNIDFNIDYLISLAKNYDFENDYIKIINGREIEYQWIGLKDKIKNIFGIDLESLKSVSENEKEGLKKRIFTNILSKVHNFSNQQKDWDKNWLKNITNNNKRNTFSNEKLQNGFNLINKQYLIHLGFGSGFTATTELIYFLTNNELKQALKKVMEKFSIGDKPGAQKRRKNDEYYNANPDNFPKSKRLITRLDIILPIGWCLINFDKEFKETEIIVEEKTQTIEINPFSGKLKQGQGGIPAEVVESGKPNKVKLFIENCTKNIILPLRNYNSELEVGTKIFVKINQMKKDGEIIDVSYEKPINL